MLPFSKRFVALLTAVAFALLLPASALAAPREDSCAAYGSFTYTLPLPDGMRTLGIHHIDWHNTFIDEDGVLQVFDNQTQIEVAAGAPSYNGQVLLRIFSNWGSLPGREVEFNVEAMRPTQAASFYVISAFLRGTPNAATDATSIRWEGAPGVWSNWIALPRSPLRSFCQENFQSLFVKQHGWIG